MRALPVPHQNNFALLLLFANIVPWRIVNGMAAEKKVERTKKKNGNIRESKEKRTQALKKGRR